MRLHCLQHVAYEGPGHAAAWAEARGHALSVTRFFAPNPVLPPLAEVGVLLVLGGAMSVHDEARLPWLADEKHYLRAALAAGVPVLGLCLGAQLVAEALGAAVGPNPAPEIGFFPVEFAAEARQHPLLRHLPAQGTALHWHGETFALPPGAQLVGHSAGCARQGFVWGDRVVGLQFHPELTPDTLRAFVRHEAEELNTPGLYLQTPAQLLANLAHLDAGPALLFPLLDELAKATVRPSGNAVGCSRSQ